MTIHSRVLCMFGQHRRSGRSIRHDGQVYHATCKGCGAPMVRELAGWRVTNETTDNAPILDAANQR